MLTSKECWIKYGDPAKAKHLVVWNVPEDLHHGIIPSKIYCNEDLVPFLEAAFENLITRNVLSQLKSFNGCFCIRRKRGGSSMSLHAWGAAIDVNAATNPIGKTPTMTPEFVKCFTDAGLEWGGNWKRPDGMHFQMKG